MSFSYHPHHPSIMWSSPGWAFLELEQGPACCPLSLCASSAAQMLPSPLWWQGTRQVYFVPFAFGACLLINTATFLLRFE